MLYVIYYKEYQAVVDNIFLTTESFSVYHSYCALFSLFGSFLEIENDISLHDLSFS